MAQSSEYPDLRFVRPRAYGAGRDGKAVRYIVVHYTAGSERSTSAEDGAASDAERTDQTSTHYFVDSDSVVQCVLTANRANSALHRGNRLGIQYELCGTAQSRAQWLDPASDATLTNAARQMARDCVKYGIPVRRLSVAETRAAWYQFPGGPRGFVGHVDVTNAYPEDGGDHTDPGTEFPWDVLLGRVQAFLSGDGDDMTPEQAQLAEGAAWRIHTLINNLPAVPANAGAGVASQPNKQFEALKAIGDRLAALEARPQVEPTPVDAASLKAALLDPDVAAALVELVRQGAEAAEDS